MHLPCEMHRALAMDGVPTGRIGRTEELGFYTHLSGSVIHRSANDSFGSLPGGCTGGAAHNPDLCNLVILDFDLILGSTEALTIFTQANLPGKAASGGWGKYPFAWYLFTR